MVYLSPINEIECVAYTVSSQGIFMLPFSCVKNIKCIFKNQITRTILTTSCKVDQALLS